MRCLPVNAFAIATLLSVFPCPAGPATAPADPSKMEWVALDPGGSAFTRVPSGLPFLPWGHNYGATSKLLEEYWQTDWDKVVRDFRDMKQMGANVVRIHLQVGYFLDAADRPREASLQQLGKVLALAEETGLYLDVTGLGCYRATANPKWYDDLGEAERWAVQCRFWEAVAEQCKGSPAVFCYDLMNEPIVAGGRREAGQWLSGKPLGGFDFVQFITLDPAGRPREQVARQWIQTLTAAIRKHDRRHLITVGQLPWVPKWGHLSGFIPEKVAPDLDFVSVHVYPEAGKVDEAVRMLKKFAVGKPLVVEETFPLSCSAAELKTFLLASRGTARGWVGHYAGEAPDTLKQLRRDQKITLGQSLMLDWLDLFHDLKADMGIQP